MPTRADRSFPIQAERGTALPGFLARLGLALSTGVILTYFSEWSFWARPLPETQPAALLGTILVYALAAYTFLTAVSFFRVRSIDALFLTGALYGWLVEGVVAQTLYQDLPLNLSWTGLAWHALLTIQFGWWALTGALQRPGIAQAAGLSVLGGLVSGLWAIWWWTETPPPTPLPSFAGYAGWTTLALAAAYALASRTRLQEFRPGRLEKLGLCLVLGAYYLLVTVPAQPLAALILPPIAGLTLVTLGRNASRERAVDLVSQRLRSGPIPLRRLAALALWPAAASGLYAGLLVLDVRLPSGMVLYAVTTTLGFFFYVRSIVRIWRRPIEGPTAVGV